MGEVYLATDTRLDRSVAIKVMPSHLSSNPALRERFEREARTISSLSHPHICALFDVGRHDDSDYLVMEYLEGETLAERLARGALPRDQVIRIGGEIAAALDRAHKQGVIHRDLKPGNIMLTKSGVKLLDFGLAKLAISANPDSNSPTSLATAQKPLTEQGSILGTYQYMSPEQLEGRDADARSDIFALGCVLYEMATGKRAFNASSKASLIAAILDRDPQPMSDRARVHGERSRGADADGARRRAGAAVDRRVVIAQRGAGHPSQENRDGVDCRSDRRRHRHRIERALSARARSRCRPSICSSRRSEEINSSATV